jgi:dihydrolipoamide dehydrogenase
LKEIPKSLVIVGAGAVGVEFASIYRSFDCEVTIVEMLPRLVPVEDEEVSKELARVYRKRGINFHTSAKVENIEKTKMELLSPSASTASSRRSRRKKS